VTCIPGGASTSVADTDNAGPSTSADSKHCCVHAVSIMQAVFACPGMLYMLLSSKLFAVSSQAIHISICFAAHASQFQKPSLPVLCSTHFACFSFTPSVLHLLINPCVYVQPDVDEAGLMYAEMKQVICKRLETTA